MKKPVKLPILMYHSVHNMAESEAADANLIGDPETFESQLKAKKRVTTPLTPLGKPIASSSRTSTQRKKFV